MGARFLNREVFGSGQVVVTIAWLLITGIWNDAGGWNDANSWKDAA